MTGPAHLKTTEEFDSLCAAYLSRSALIDSTAALDDADVDEAEDQAYGLRVVAVRELANLEGEILAELDLRGDTTTQADGATWAVYRCVDSVGKRGVSFMLIERN